MSAGLGDRESTSLTSNEQSSDGACSAVVVRRIAVFAVADAGRSLVLLPELLPT